MQDAFHTMTGDVVLLQLHNKVACRKSWSDSVLAQLCGAHSSYGCLTVTTIEASYICGGAQAEVAFTQTLPLALTKRLDTLLGLLCHFILIC